jgi:hypothetical protein
MLALAFVLDLTSKDFPSPAIVYARIRSLAKENSLS